MTKLEKMLKYVSEHNEFYKNRIKEYGIKDPLDITQWPVLTREELQENKWSLLTDTYHGKEFNSLIKKKSSGSSGMPVSVYWNSNDFFQSTIPSWRLRKKHYSILPTSKQVNYNMQSFEANNEIAQLSYKEESNSISINKTSLINDDAYWMMYQKICAFRTEWMYTTPYLLRMFVDFINKYRLEKPRELRYVECAGEIFIPEEELRLKNELNINVANMYGAEETNGIALECPYGNMHVMEENVYVECYNNNGYAQKGEGEIIVTSLCNSVMPLIRYNLGDIVVIDDKTKCPCGNPHKIISIIKGRKIDTFTYNGQKTTVYALVESMNCLNNMIGDPIKRYKFIYNSQNKVLNSYIQLDDKFLSWKDMIVDELRKVFKSKKIFAKEINIYVNEPITFGKHGKFKILEII